MEVIRLRSPLYVEVRYERMTAILNLSEFLTMKTLIAWKTRLVRNAYQRSIEKNVNSRARLFEPFVGSACNLYLTSQSSRCNKARVSFVILCLALATESLTKDALPGARCRAQCQKCAPAWRYVGEIATACVGCVVSGTNQFYGKHICSGKSGIIASARKQSSHNRHD